MSAIHLNYCNIARSFFMVLQKMTILIVPFLLFLHLNPAFGRNLGTYGKTFEIAEEDFLKELQDRLDLQKIQAFQKSYAEGVKAQIKRPRPISGIAKATINCQREFDPTFTLAEDIYVPVKPGSNAELTLQLLYAKGMKLNPLDYHSLDQKLVFIDGDDEEQIKFATQKHPGQIILLVNGEPGLRDGQYYYFDQFGTYSKHFGITKVPSVIWQDEKVLKIQEVALDE